MRYDEVIYTPNDPNREGWEQKHRDLDASETNWLRLSRIVFTDLFAQTGLDAHLSRSQRARLDRRNQIALNPATPRTRSEIRRAERGHQPGFPVWALPILLGAAAVGTGVEALERYSKTSKPGSTFAANRVEALDRHLTLSEAITGNDEVAESYKSRLMPEIRIGDAALLNSGEPADYIINVAELLEAAEASAAQDGLKAHLENEIGPDIFAKLAPNPLSREDQRARAAEVFVRSSLLSDQELFLIQLERRADFFPDGGSTFRIHTSTPYAYLYEGMDVTGGYQPVRQPFAERILDTDPIRELLQRSAA